MFDNKKDPMVDVVQKVMDENVRRRQIEADFNEELGIQDRKQLGHEKHDLYDQALLQRINEAVLSPKQKKIAAIAGNPKKIDAPDLAKLRGMKNEANDVKANEEPPFEPDAKKSTSWKNPQSKAKNLARKMMKKMKAKQDIKEEEQIVNERVLYSHSHSDTKVIRKSKKGDKEGSAIEVHKNGKKVATGDYDRGADAFFVNVGGKGQKSFDTAKDVANHFHDIKEEQIDEERKRTSAVSSAFLAGKPAKQKELQTNGQEMTYHGNVIAKHAGDEVHVTTAGYGHSPSTRGHINGVLSRLGAPGLSQKRGKLMHGDTEVGTRDWIKIKKPTDTMSEGNYTTPRDKYDKIERDLVGDVKSSKSYDEKLRKEQKLRVYRRKNVEHKKTMSEEQIDELSKKKLGDYIKKASHDVATKSAATGRFGEKSRKHSEDALASSAGPGDTSGAGLHTKWEKTMAAIDTDKMANKFFRKSWKRREGIAKAVDRLKRGRPHNVTNEDVSLESVQEEIRNNLLERANSLLEHGSREQIVEFMNNLTVEQRSILNMQEASAEPKPIDPNMQENILASAARILGSLRPNFAKGVQTGKTGVTSGGAGQTVTSTGQLGSSIRSPIGQTKVGDFPAQIAGRAGMAVGANPGKTAGAALGVGAAVGAGVATRVGSPVTPAAAAPAPESDAYNASEIQRPFDKTPSAAPKAAAPVTGAPAPPPKPDYGSGNADAGFERGKYAKPDASDNSSGANELRSKQQAVDKHTENLGESKSKYMSESTMIRNLLRNR